MVDRAGGRSSGGGGIGCDIAHACDLSMGRKLKMFQDVPRVLYPRSSYFPNAHHRQGNGRSHFQVTRISVTGYDIQLNHKCLSRSLISTPSTLR